MIASNNILPPPGDPGALSRLIMDYRNQKQREAVVNQGMQFDQNRNQGVLIQTQMAQVQLDELKANAPIRARREEAAADLAETQAKTAADELLRIQRKNGFFGTATRVIDGAFIAAQNLAKMEQIRLATLATKESNDRKLFKDAFASLTNENTGETYATYLLANLKEAARLTGLPEAEIPPLVAHARDARKRVAAENALKRAADERANAENSPAGQVEFGVRRAAEAGNFTQAFALVRGYLLTIPGFNAQLADARGDQAEMVRIYDAHVFSYLDALGLGDKARQYLAEKADALEHGDKTRKYLGENLDALGYGDKARLWLAENAGKPTDPSFKTLPPPRIINPITRVIRILRDGRWVDDNQTR